MTREQKPDKFLPAFFVDEIDRRRSFASGELPLHITLMSPLHAPYDGSVYTSTLKQELNPLPSFLVTVGELDEFVHEDTTYDVYRIVDSEKRLDIVRRKLFQILGHLDHDTTYDDSFAPHITVPTEIDKILVRKGQEIEVAGFSIVEQQYGDLWRVREKIGFQGGNDASTT